MANTWKPKYPHKCGACGWKGPRSEFPRACPDCGHWRPLRTDLPTSAAVDQDTQNSDCTDGPA